MEWSVFALSDAGMVRHRNEDIAAVGHRLFRNEHEAWTQSFPDAGVTVTAGVCDGVGGSAAGDVASRFAMERFVSGIDSLGRGLGEEALQEELRGLVRGIHDEVVRQGLLHAERQGMATTLSGFVWYEGRLYLAHAGDSRLYLLREGSLTRLTRDHTLREFTGNLRIPGNILVNCIGVERDFFVDVAPAAEEAGKPGDRLLACTDGLTDTVPEGDIAEILSRGHDEETAGTELLSRANAAGAHDNVTFVLIGLG
mgnify:CR=1 FL=1